MNSFCSFIASSSCPSRQDKCFWIRSCFLQKFLQSLVSPEDEEQEPVASSSKSDSRITPISMLLYFTQDLLLDNHHLSCLPPFCLPSSFQHIFHQRHEKRLVFTTSQETRITRETRSQSRDSFPGKRLSYTYFCIS